MGAAIATGPVTLATGTRGERALTADAVRPRRRIVVLGAGRVGRIVVRAVRMRGFACVVVDRDQRALEEVVKLGAETLFGDAANPEILRRCELDRAPVLVITIGDHLTARLATERARRISPRLTIAARARGRHEIDGAAGDRGAPGRGPGGGGGVRARSDGAPADGCLERGAQRDRRRASARRIRRAITAGAIDRGCGDVGLQLADLPGRARSPTPIAARTRGRRHDHRAVHPLFRRRRGHDRADGHRRRAGRRRRGPDVRCREPGHGRVIATAPLGGKPDVDRAVDAARRAFDDPKGWATWPATKRGRTLAKFAQLIRDHSRSSPSSRRATSASRSAARRGEIVGAAFVFDYYAGAANKLFGETIPVSKPGLDFTLREPIGVVGLIVPVELPAADGLVEAGPGARGGQHRDPQAGLATHRSPRCALGELALEAGIPKGVLNVITGPGGTAGASMAAHEGIGKVAFTGETTTGQEIMRLASANVKKISPRARRQEPQHRVRRRRPRAVRAGVAVLGVRQLRPGLLRAVADPRRAVRARARRGAVRGGHAEREGRRPDRTRRPRSGRWSR